MMNMFLKYGCRHDYRQFAYLGTAHPGLATSGITLPATVKPPHNRKVHTGYTRSDIRAQITEQCDYYVGLAIAYGYGIFAVAVELLPLPVAVWTRILLWATAIIALFALLGLCRRRYYTCRQRCWQQLTHTTDTRVTATVNALRRAYPRYCMVTGGTTVAGMADIDIPPYYVYMTADAPAVHPGQAVTTGNQYLVIRGMYESPYDAAGVGCSIDTLTIRADAQVTPATPVTCIRTEPLRYFALRVVHGIGGDNGAC